MDQADITCPIICTFLEKQFDGGATARRIENPDQFVFTVMHAEKRRTAIFSWEALHQAESNVRAYVDREGERLVERLQQATAPVYVRLTDIR